MIQKKLNHLFTFLIYTTLFTYNFYILVMIIFLLASLFISFIFYLDLTIQLLWSPFFPLSILLLALLFIFILKKSFFQKIKNDFQLIKVAYYDGILIFFAFVSYIYFILQIFYHNFFDLLKLGNDIVAHRLISHELFLNSENGLQLVIRDTQTGSINFTDIFYPIGFHSIIYYFSELFSISIDYTIYITFLIIWIVVIPLTIFFVLINITKSIRISLIFFILFLSSSEILIQYYYSGLWPFLLGVILSLFLIGLSYPLDVKRMLSITPLLLGLLIIYPSFAAITILIIFVLNFSFRKAYNFKINLLYKAFIIIILISIFLIISFFKSNIYINFLIIYNSVKNFDMAKKLLEQDNYINFLHMRYFDFESSKLLISIFLIISIFLYVFSKEFRIFLPKKILFLYTVFAISLLTSQASGIIGLFNFLINPLGLLFYFDFNRIYIIYLFFSILIISYAFYYLIFSFKKVIFLYVYILFICFLQVNSSFTDRLNTYELPIFSSLKLNSNFDFKVFDDEQFSMHCNLPIQDPTFICYTHFGFLPRYFNDEITISTRVNFY